MPQKHEVKETRYEKSHNALFYLHEMSRIHKSTEIDYRLLAGVPDS